MALRPLKDYTSFALAHAFLGLCSLPETQPYWTSFVLSVKTTA
jgi:hypothetical protein